jgi:hypothetical protein
MLSTEKIGTESLARKRAYTKQWQRDNPGYWKKYRLENPEKHRTAHRRWYAANKGTYAPVRKERYYALKARVYEVLGNVCNLCGFKDHRALQIDHVENNGYKERQAKLRTVSFYIKIIKNGTDGYQLLCANCNWIKRAEVEKAARDWSK